MLTCSVIGHAPQEGVHAQRNSAPAAPGRPGSHLPAPRKQHACRGLLVASENQPGVIPPTRPQPVAGTKPKRAGCSSTTAAGPGAVAAPPFRPPELQSRPLHLTTDPGATSWLRCTERVDFAMFSSRSARCLRGFRLQFNSLPDQGPLKGETLQRRRGGKFLNMMMLWVQLLLFSSLQQY